MANFTKNSMCDGWLTRMGVQYKWRSNLKMDVLHEHWNCSLTQHR